MVLIVPVPGHCLLCTLNFHQEATRGRKQKNRGGGTKTTRGRGTDQQRGGRKEEKGRGRTKKTGRGTYNHYFNV